MAMTRRDALVSGSATLLALGFPRHLRAADITADQAIAAFTKGADIQSGKITLTLEDVAEDGFKVPIEVTAPGAAALLIVAPQNPVPALMTAQFGAFSDEQRIATRIRLARSQEVLALAKMPDGQVFGATHPVAVVLGGCGA